MMRCVFISLLAALGAGVPGPPTGAGPRPYPAVRGRGQLQLRGGAPAGFRSKQELMQELTVRAALAHAGAARREARGGATSAAAQSDSMGGGATAAHGLLRFISFPPAAGAA